MKLRRREGEGGGGGRSIRNNRKKTSKNNHRHRRRISLVGCILRLAFVLWVLLLIFGAWIILLFHQHHNNNNQNISKNKNDDKFSTEAVRNNNEQEEVTTRIGFHHNNNHDHDLPDSSSKMQLLRNSSSIQQQQPLTDYNNKKKKKKKKEEKKVNPWMKNNIDNNRLIVMKKGFLYQKNPLLYKEECEDYQHEIPHPYHGCEINTYNMIVSCTFNNLKIDTTKIISYEGGGESLDTPGIMGRSEDMEIPKYIKGAFQIILNNNNNNNATKPNIDDRIYQDNTTFQKLRYIGDILNNLEVVDVDVSDDDGKKKMMSNDCVETWSGTTLFITRYEYANLYHTLTDWWNAYFSLPPKIRNRSNRSKGKNQNEDNNNNNNDDDNKIHLVFLDSHAEGRLDEVWEKLMFGTKPMYVKNLPSEGGICFDKAILIPVGYRSELFPHKKELSRLRQQQHGDCPNRYLAKEFSDHILKSYGLLSSSFDDDKNDNNNMEHQQLSSNNYHHQVQKGKIVIIDRKPYVAHPRSVIGDGTTKRMIENLADLQHALLEEGGVQGVVTSVKLIRLETLTFEEQLKSIRAAHVLIGNHGAGLSHTMFMDPYTQIVLELNPVREFFSYLSDWKGIRYESWETSTKGPRLSSEDIEAITKVVSRLLSG